MMLSRAQIVGLNFLETQGTGAGRGREGLFYVCMQHCGLN